MSLFFLYGHEYDPCMSLPDSMKRSRPVMSSLAIIYCLSIFVPGVMSQTGLTEEDKQLIIDTHNQARRDATPSGSNLQFMVCHCNNYILIM